MMIELFECLDGTWRPFPDMTPEDLAANERALLVVRKEMAKMVNAAIERQLNEFWEKMPKTVTIKLGRK